MKIRLWFLLSLSVSAIAWLYATKVLNPWQEYVRSHHPGVKAQMWDLYPRWVGTRELLLHGRNPYSTEVSHEIQMVYYGHVVTQDYAPGHKIVDEWRFVYPVYVVFLMAPLIHVDFSEVQRWAPSVLGLLAALCVPLCIDLLHWRLPWTAVATITLFTVSSPQIVQVMHHQQLAVVVGFLLIAGAWCVYRNHLASAGALLAWSTIKPQMALFPLCFFLVWVIGDWRKRWRLLAGFLSALAILIGAGELILPGWIGYFMEGANAYRRYFPTTSLLRVALGDTLGEIVGGVYDCIHRILNRDNTLLPFVYAFQSDIADFAYNAHPARLENLAAILPHYFYRVRELAVDYFHRASALSASPGLAESARLAAVASGFFFSRLPAALADDTTRNHRGASAPSFATVLSLD
jgi:hypothetical protein